MGLDIPSDANMLPQQSIQIIFRCIIHDIIFGCADGYIFPMTQKCNGRSAKVLQENTTPIIASTAMVVKPIETFYSHMCRLDLG